MKTNIKLLIAILIALNFISMADISEAGVTQLDLKFYHEGLYSSDLNRMIKPVHVKVSLRNFTPPYILVDSVSSTIDVQGNTTVSLSIPYNQGFFYIVISGWNLLQTWSTLPQIFTENQTTNYNFSSDPTKAFGDNMKRIDDSPLRWGIYQGDINQNTVVDLEDVYLIYNASNIYSTGNLITDLTGEEIVDGDDILIATNYANSYLASIVP